MVRRLWGGHPRGRLELGQAGAHEETAASGVTLVRRAMHGDLRACGFCSFAPHLTASAGRRRVSQTPSAVFRERGLGRAYSQGPGLPPAGGTRHSGHGCGRGRPRQSLEAAAEATCRSV